MSKYLITDQLCSARGHQTTPPGGHQTNWILGRSEMNKLTQMRMQESKIMHGDILDFARNGLMDNVGRVLIKTLATGD